MKDRQAFFHPNIPGQDSAIGVLASGQTTRIPGQISTTLHKTDCGWRRVEESPPDVIAGQRLWPLNKPYHKQINITRLAVK
jgi:hypothetical protein